MVRRLISDDSLGAWLLKCQPRVNRDVPLAIVNGTGGPVTRWCVADNYRTRMMARGDRVVLWVSGDGRQVARGIWGLGWVTGEARGVVGRDGTAPATKEVLLHLPLLRRGVLEEEIRSAGVDDLEVLRQPQGSNPSWVSKDQLSAIADLCGTWPSGP